MLIAYDCQLLRPGCVLLQVALGADRHIAHQFPTETWLTAPTPGLRLYNATPAQLIRLIEATKRGAMRTECHCGLIMELSGSQPFPPEHRGEHPKASRYANLIEIGNRGLRTLEPGQEVALEMFPPIANGCRFCGRRIGGECKVTTCLNCGANQCESNGMRAGLCAVCLVGYLVGFRRPETCSYKRCPSPPVAEGRIRRRAVCKPHLELQRKWKGANLRYGEMRGEPSYLGWVKVTN